MTGIGTAFAFIAVSIGALAGIEERDAGLASGLLNTSQQLGGAIGVAMASRIAASRFHTLISHGHRVPVALTGGFQWALWFLALTARAAVPLAFLILGRPRVDRSIPAETGNNLVLVSE